MEELATAGRYGRSYLGWCMNNLQNPALRRAAEQALIQFGSRFNELAMRKLMASDPEFRDLTPGDIEREIENEIISVAEEDAYNKKLEACNERLRGDLVAIGCTDQVVKFVISNTLDADKIFASIKFSSIDKQVAFTAAWNRYEDSLPTPGF